MYGKSPIKFEKIINEKTLENKKLFLWTLSLPKTDLSSIRRFAYTMSNVLENWDFWSQNNLGKINSDNKLEAQLRPKLSEKILILGSNEEKRLDILNIKLYILCPGFGSILRNYQLSIKSNFYRIQAKGQKEKKKIKRKSQFMGLIWGIIIYNHI